VTEIFVSSDPSGCRHAGSAQKTQRFKDGELRLSAAVLEIG